MVGEPVPDAVSERVEDVLVTLRARGGRVTTARRLLLSALFQSHGHRTAEELAADVRGLAPDVHVSTIYRNLDELERAGVLVHTHLGHGPATYHLATDAHAHLVCRDCGALQEVPDELLAGLVDEALQRYGFALDPHHFALLGRCSGCAAGVQV